MDMLTKNLQALKGMEARRLDPDDGDFAGYCPECGSDMYGDRWEWACSECDYEMDNLP